jgi:hypothetical protein
MSIDLQILDTQLRVFPNGDIQRQLKSGTWKSIKNTANHNQGYNVIVVNKKQFMRSRIVGKAFLQLELNDKMVLHHKDGNRLNCAVDNLTIESYSSISFYRTDTHGYHHDIKNNVYISIITHNGLTRRLGTFTTPDEAYDCYIQERSRIHV